MKKYFSLILVMLVFGQAYTQSWSSWYSTIFSGAFKTLEASAVDRQGIHVLYKDGTTLKYGLFDSQGNIIRQNVSVLSNVGNYVAMSAFDGKVFIGYEQSGQIKVARSTDGRCELEYRL